MFWLLIGIVLLLIVFDAIITMRRRPQWRRSAEQAHAHLQQVAPDSEKARMDRESFVNHYLGLCQKATTKSRLGVITGLGLLWFAAALTTSASQEEPVGMLNFVGMAVALVALPAPVLIKMVGVRKAKHFAEPPADTAEPTATTDAAE